MLDRTLQRTTDMGVNYVGLFTFTGLSFGTSVYAIAFLRLNLSLDAHVKDG